MKKKKKKITCAVLKHNWDDKSRTAEINIGDRVIDGRGFLSGWSDIEQGEFKVEKINKNGVWGSGMKTPYCNGKKAFLDYNIILKIEDGVWEGSRK